MFDVKTSKEHSKQVSRCFLYSDHCSSGLKVKMTWTVSGPFKNYIVSLFIVKMWLGFQKLWEKGVCLLTVCKKKSQMAPLFLIWPNSSTLDLILTLFHLISWKNISPVLLATFLACCFRWSCYVLKGDIKDIWSVGGLWCFIDLENNQISVTKSQYVSEVDGQKPFLVTHPFGKPVWVMHWYDAGQERWPMWVKGGQPSSYLLVVSHWQFPWTGHWLFHRRFPISWFTVVSCVLSYSILWSCTVTNHISSLLKDDWTQ